MKITYNGTDIVTNATTIEELAKLQNVNLHSVVVLVNGQTIPNEVYASTLLSENDKIDMIKYIVGG